MEKAEKKGHSPTRPKNGKKQQQIPLGELLAAYWWLLVVVIIAAVGATLSISSLCESDYFPVGFLQQDQRQHSDRLIDQRSLEIGSGALQLMWATPIFTVNLHNNSKILGTDLDTSALNRGLHAAVLAEFSGFMKELEAKDDQGTSKSGSSSRAYNELFFAWQRDAWESNKRTAMDKYPEFKHIKAIMKSAAATFLDMTGRVIPEKTELFSWATIHKECMFHLAHTHPHNLVSGVYYARVPEGAGDIIFDDPRGPLPPFQNRIIHSPKEGDLIVFPSWLLHQVSPTLGNDERISFSFNIQGDWTQTADVSLTIPFT